jgi:hypothetical protein
MDYSEEQRDSMRVSISDFEMNSHSPEVGWEFNRKHIFVLSASGKPIYSRYGDEQQLVTTFGLLQAVISIIRDSGDELKCIISGNRRIVYFIKNSLYFICISSTSEPELILQKQLKFMYSLILLVMTSKVHDVLSKQPSADLRQLLGVDTTRLMNAACVSDLTTPSIAFDALKSFVCSKEVREELGGIIKTCVENSGAE